MPALLRNSLCLACLTMAATGSGCSTFSSNVVSEDVVKCRQNCQQGYAAIRENKWDAADEHFNAAIETNPADQRARSGWAAVLWHQGRHDEAIDQMLQAVRVSGGDPQLRVQLGEMYLEKGDVAKAADQASRAIATEASLATAWALEGDTLAKRGDWEAALSRYHRALSFQPEFSAVEIKTAEVYRRLGRPQRAYSVLTQLEKRGMLGSNPQRVLKLQALCCNELGRHQEATRRWSQLANQFEASPDVLFELASAQLRAGNLEAAHHTAQQALALDPTHGPNRRLAAQLRQGRSPVR